MARQATQALQQLAKAFGDMEAELDVSRAALAAQGLTLIETPRWAKGLTRQQRELMGVLLKAAPRAVDRWDILECLTPLDHASERDPHLVTRQVGRIRSILGTDSIETVSQGYRLSDAFRERMIAGG